MKKLLTIFILLIPSMLYAASAWDSGDIKKNSNCNQSLYYSIGKLCVDTDDAKLYKGTGSAVVEISNVVTGLTSASSVAITGGTIDGTTVGATTPAAGTFTVLKGNPDIVTDSSTGTVPDTEMKGQIHLVTGAYTRSMNATLRNKARFRATTAAAFSLDVVTGTDVIRLNGTALPAGNKVTTDGTINNTIECECSQAGYIDCNSIVGLATDGGA